MDREIFKGMTDTERIEWIESEYLKGETNATMVKKYGIPKNTIGDTLKRNGFTYDDTLKRYIKHVYNSYEHVVEKTKEETLKEQGAMILQQEHNKNILPANIEKDLLTMIKWYKLQQNKENDREELFNWIRQQRDKSNIIEAPEIYLDSNKLKGNVKTRSFTVYEGILNEFLEFCKKKPYTQQDLLGMALIEYMSKYSR